MHKEIPYPEYNSDVFASVHVAEIFFTVDNLN